MAFKPFKVEQTADRQVNQIQQNVKAAFEQARTCPILDGRMVGPITFQAAVGQDVPHLLGRDWVGFIPISYDRLPAATVPGQTDKSKYLTIGYNASCTITFWVF